MSECLKHISIFECFDRPEIYLFANLFPPSKPPRENLNTEEVDTNTEAAAAADTNTEPAEPAAAATEETVQPPAKKQATRRLLMKGMSRGELLKKVQEKQEQAPAASSKVIMDVVTFGDIIAIVRFNPDDGYNWFPKVAEGIAFAKAKGLRGFAWEDSSKFATTIT